MLPAPSLAKVRRHNDRILKWTLLLLLAIAACALVCGCGSSGSRGSTNSFDGSQVKLDDALIKKGRAQGGHNVTRVTVTPPAPASQPGDVSAQAAASQPVRVTVDGRSIEAPAGSSVSVEADDRGAEIPDQLERKQSASAQGPTVRSDKDSVTNVKGDAPELKTHGFTSGGDEGGGGTADGGDFSAITTPIIKGLSASSRLAVICGVIGIGLILMGIAIAVLPRMVPALSAILPADGIASMACVVAGVAFLATAVVVDKYPWFFLVALIIALLVGAWYIWHKYSLHKKDQEIARKSEALTSVVAGVEGASPDAQDEVKKSVSANGGDAPAVKATIQEVKASLVP